MSTRRDEHDWLEWAREKRKAALERFEWSERASSPTVESYEALVGVIERGIRRGGTPPEVERLAKLADEMEELGAGGFALDAQATADAARAIREAVRAWES